MGGKGSKLTPKDLKDLRGQTNFSEPEIKLFHQDFKKKHPSGKLTKADIIDMYRNVFPEGDPGPLSEHMFGVYDTDKNGYVDFREFMTGIGLLAHGTPEQKLRVIFNAYDFDNNGYISKWEFQGMAAAVYKAVDPIQGKQHGNYESYISSSRLFDRLDKNDDAKVTFEEFREAARHDPHIQALLD